MTVPSYTEDLTDIDLAANDTNWEECAAAGWNTGGSSTYDTDYPYIQGSGAVTQQATKSAIGGLMVDNGSGITLPTDGAYFVWQVFASSTGLDTYANGGMRVVVGSDRNNFKSWDVGGKDFGRNPYGGWMNHAINSTVTADDTVGTPTATEQYSGAAYKSLVAIGKGNPHGVDAIRYGRGSSIFEYGETSNYCTFAGFAIQNDNSNNMWGLVQKIAGGYLYKGKMTLGTATNACDFRDSNTSVHIDNTPKVTANFNTIEVNNASSRVDWSNVKITALGTVSPGRLVCNANANLNWDLCQFTDMGTFVLGGTNSEILNSIWNRCNLITVVGGKLNGSKVLEPSVATDASAINWNVTADPDGNLNDMVFSIGANAHHAIEFGATSPLSITLRGMELQGFNALNGQNDSAFYIARTSGTVTINIVGGTGNFTYKSAGAIVNIVIDPVTTKFIIIDSISKDPIQGAAVFVKAKDGTGSLPFEDSVTITRSGTTATVSHTGHGLMTNHIVEIKGADQNEYNRIKIITVIDTNSYSFIVLGSPATPATGTIKSTGVLINGDSDALGEISDTRSFSLDQSFIGTAKKGSFEPVYVSSSLSGTVDKTTGKTTVVPLIAD